MFDPFRLFAYFIAYPLAATGPAIGLTLLALVSGLLLTTDRRPPACFWLFLVSAVMWWAYTAWESSTSKLIQTLPPGPAIRADLLLLIPALLITPLVGVCALTVSLVDRFRRASQPEKRLRSWQDEDDTHA